jgi:hypothetical protein
VSRAEIAFRSAQCAYAVIKKVNMPSENVLRHKVENLHWSTTVGESSFKSMLLPMAFHGSSCNEILK